MVQLRAKLCFTSEATLFGGAIDARALEQCDLICMRAEGNDVERVRVRERGRDVRDPCLLDC